jgi:hypothetical protein
LNDRTDWSGEGRVKERVEGEVRDYKKKLKVLIRLINLFMKRHRKVPLMCVMTTVKS